MNDSQLQIIISAKDLASKVMDGVRGKVQDMQGAFGRFTSGELNRFNDSIQNATNLLQIGLIGGLAAAGTAVGLFVKNTMEMEQTRIGFEGLTGSVAKTDALMAQLIETAKKTPLQFTDVAKGAENLLAFGISSDTVNEKLKMLGDIARGNVTKFGLLSNVYGQVKAAGRLMGQDLLQFTSQGIPLIAGLAQHFGVAESSIKKMIEEGKVGFSDVDSVLQNLTKTGGIFNNAMELQSTTLSGTISNLQDSFFGLGRELLGMDVFGNIQEGGGFYYLKEGAQKLLGAVTDNISNFKNLATVLFKGDFTGSIFGLAENDPIINTLFQIREGFKLTFDFITSNTPASQAVLVGFGTIIVGLLAGIAISAAMAMAPFVLIAAVIGGLYYAWTTNFGGMQDSLMSFWAVAQPVLDALWSSFKERVIPVAMEMGQALTSLWDVIKPVIIPIIQALAITLGVILVGAIYVVIEALRATASFITYYANTAAAGIVMIQDQFTSLANTANNIRDNIITAFFSIQSGIVNTFDSAKSQVQGAFVGMFSGVSGAVQSVFRGVFDGIRGVLNAGINNLNGVINAVKDLPVVGDTVRNVSIPTFATGVTNFSGGLALVGEQGPELINLPKGSDVYTAGQTRRMQAANNTTNNQQSFGNVTIQIIQQPGQSAQSVAQQVIDALSNRNTMTQLGLNSPMY